MQKPDSDNTPKSMGRSAVTKANGRRRSPLDLEWKLKGMVVAFRLHIVAIHAGAN